MNTTELNIPSNKVRDIERYCHTELDSMYGADEVRMFVRILFEEYLGWSRTDLLLNKEDTINQSDLLRFHWAVNDLKHHRPIQHIIGYTEFCGCRIDVDKSALIPRPETEEIVRQVINNFSNNEPRHILDLCTGSGCIAIALAKQWPEAEVWAVDISDKALALAEKNAQNNNTEVHFLKADMLSGLAIGNTKFDIIISNPPYVKESERRSMQRNVLDWEPEQALFVPDSDPLLFYKAIAQIAAHSMNRNGLLVVEINEKFGDETCKVLHGEGFETELATDFRGKNRSVWGKMS